MADFDVQDAVRVRADMPPGHVRTPAYLRGKSGVIERVIGHFPNPEHLAYRQKGAPALLLRVRFKMHDVWQDCATSEDVIEAEIYDHWLVKEG